MKIIILTVIIIQFTFLNLSALEKLPKSLEIGEKTYVVRLNNGDVFTGEIAEFIFSEEEGEGLKLITELGKAPIYAHQIKEIKTMDEYYRHDHRVFLLQSAYPISNNHYIGAFELVFFNLGVGITDYFSLTAGRSAVPGIYSNQQLTNLNMKATLVNFDWSNEPGGMAVALSTNLAYLNDANKYINILGTVSFKMKKSIFTTSLIYKAGGEDFNNIKIRDQIFPTRYENGAMGIGLGLDNRFTNWKDLHFIGELWNSNITKPSNTGIFLGLRFSNSKVSTDFGLAFFTAGVAAPFASFVWTPF